MFEYLNFKQCLNLFTNLDLRKFDLKFIFFLNFFIDEGNSSNEPLPARL